MRSNRSKTLLTIAIAAAGVLPIGLGAGSALPQVKSPATETARFDAASVKPSRLDAVVGGGFRIEPGHFMANNTTVEGLVRFAYGLERGDKEAVAGRDEAQRPPALRSDGDAW